MAVRSIRSRLTLWYAGILAVLLALFAGGVYLTMRQTLYESLDDGIENRATLTFELITYDASGRPRFELATGLVDLDDHFQRLFSAEGDLIFDNSDAFGDVPVDRDAVGRALSGRGHRGTVDGTEQQARIHTFPIVRDGEIVGVLQAGDTTADVTETLNKLLLVIAIGLPLALLFAGAGGYWLSTRALAPIDAITRTARDIGEHDLSRRLALDLPDDEVGRLARTFDGMIARLDAAFQRQRQFTADASHELRTPLTAVRGQIDVALQAPREPAEYRQTLATINEQVDRMTRLVGGLLMLARSDARALPVERERVAVADLVRALAAQVRALAEGKGLTLDLTGEGEPIVIGDEDLLLQLVLNLTDNAVKYTDSGGLTLGWRSVDGLVEISVRDTGAGIHRRRANAFERFYRVDAARSREQGGAGLGLAICRSIAEAHGGEIRLDSSEAGSVFTVRLPVA